MNKINRQKAKTIGNGAEKDNVKGINEKGRGYSRWEEMTMCLFPSTIMANVIKISS